MADVLVIGSINQDFVLQVACRPNPGETVTNADLSLHAGGKGANQAAACAVLGAETQMLGRVGDDKFGPLLVSGLARYGVNVSKVEEIPGTQTGSAFIVVTPDGENSIVVAPGANAFFHPDKVENVLTAISNTEERPKLMTLQMEIPPETVWHSVRFAERLGIRVLLNLAPATKMPDDVMRILDPIVLNESETSFVLGEQVRGVKQSTIAAERIRSTGCRSVVVTLGFEGAVFSSDTGSILHVPAPKVSPVDTTAAGDVFVGALSGKLARGSGMDEAVAYAVRASAVAVTKKGAQSSLPSLEEVSAV